MLSHGSDREQQILLHLEVVMLSGSHPPPSLGYDPKYIRSGITNGIVRLNSNCHGNLEMGVKPTSKQFESEADAFTDFCMEAATRNKTFDDPNIIPSFVGSCYGKI